MAQTLNQIADSMPDNLAAERAAMRWLASGGVRGGRGVISGAERESYTQGVLFAINMLIRYALVGRTESRDIFSQIVNQLPRDKFNVLIPQSQLDQYKRQVGGLTATLGKSIKEIQAQWREFERYAMDQKDYKGDPYHRSSEFQERQRGHQQHVRELEQRKREVSNLEDQLRFYNLVPLTAGGQAIRGNRL